jgi:glycosyltransferase involved in cell wall biosynthesis
MKRLSVLLTTEGTYPHHGGGVSTWCHALTHRLREVDFTILSVAMHPYLAHLYELAPNVREHVTVPLWGTADPAESRPGLGYAAFLERRAAAASEQAQATFDALWRSFVVAALSRQADALPQLTTAVVGLHQHFASHDYRVSFGDARAWRSFVAASLQAWSAEQRTPEPTLAELTEAFRLAYRFLIVLDADVPESDVTHSAAAGLCGLPCIVAKVTRGTPYLLTEHGIYLREQYLNLRRTTRSPFVRWFACRLIGAITDLNYMHADLVAPVCDYNTRWERWRGVSSDRIRVIYNGVDPARFAPCPPAANARPTVVSVSQIFALKGQLDLIEAAAQVRCEIPDVEFRIYGAVTDERYYQQCLDKVAALDLKDTVTFCGSTSRPWEAYRRADVVALASVSEGFPFAVIEAMLCRRAVVATEVGGVGEAIGETGVLVPSRSPSRLAAVVTELLRQPAERERLAGMACARAGSLFTEDRFIKAYSDSYTSLHASSSSEAARVVATAA